MSDNEKRLLLETLLVNQTHGARYRVYQGRCARCNIGKNAKAFRSITGRPIPQSAEVHDLPHLSSDNYRLCTQCATEMNRQAEKDDLSSEEEEQPTPRPTPQVCQEVWNFLF
jgi:hypothetical protein